MAGFLDGVAGNLLGKIADAASQSETRPIQSELRKLEIMVSTIKFMLMDAEEKQANEPELAPLLRQLKDVFSQAEELIDEIECDYLKSRVQNRRSDGEKVLCIFSSSNFTVYAPKINKIRETLDDFEAKMSRLHLVEKDNMNVKNLKSEMSFRTSITGSEVFGRILRSKKETILSDDYDSIIGREEAKGSIIPKLLMSGDHIEQYPIFAIYGIDGMGKTTLANLVYNDNEVLHYFDKRMWICVSADFDVERMRKEILSYAATGEEVTDALTKCKLQNRLQRNLVGRRFLLVLDDVGTLDYSRESELKEILKMGANGSKIIVTTRSEPILHDMSGVHKIQKLNEENSMELFESTVRNKNLAEDLHRVAEELVPKCDGVPLAIKFLAGLLSSKIDDPEQVNVKEIWKRDGVKDIEGILPALKLSYDLMPCYLKPCLLSFSVLPKDYVFYSYELIQLWMAQGLIQSDNNNLEIIGEQYFKELWSRGFLEDVEEYALGYWFKVHSLVHDLAIQLAKKDQEKPENLHHLSFVDSRNKDLPQSTSSKIQSLVVPVGGVEPKINGVSLVKCISKFKQLRILYLCNSSLESIPASIDTLTHLRYFDLRGNREIKRLPESVCNLQNLQSLILAFCSELEELPKNIKNMVNLRFLWITTKQANLGRDGIGGLSSLRFLAIGGCQNLTQLFEDIDKLKSLQTLIIYDCKSLLTVPKGLRNLSGLQNIAIWGCEQFKFTFSKSMLSDLGKLTLKGFPFAAWLPRWTHEMYLETNNLQVLEIGDFPKLRTLSSDWFSDLRKLRILEISNCPRLTDLPHCPNLKELRVTFCGSLGEKCVDQNKHSELEISHVPNIYINSRKIKRVNMAETGVVKLEGS